VGVKSLMQPLLKVSPNWERARGGLRLGGVGDARWRRWGQWGLRTYRWYGGGLQEDRVSKPIARNSHGSCRPCLRYYSRDKRWKGHIMFFQYVSVFCLRSFSVVVFVSVPGGEVGARWRIQTHFSAIGASLGANLFEGCAP